jgi:murein DD-endopeptidase MepM/ murein hydrolase activator NlpD
MRKILSIFIIAAILITLSPRVEVLALTAEEQQIEQLRQQIAELEKQAAQYRGNVASERAKADSLKKEISIIQNQIGGIEAQIALTGKKIDKTKLEIQDVEGNIVDTESQIDARKETIGRLLVFLNRQDEEPLITSLIKNRNMSDFFRQGQYLANINTQLLALVEELDQAKKTLEGDRTNLQTKQEELEQLKQESQTKKLELAFTKSSKSTLLTRTKGQEAEYQKLLTETEKRERDANLEVFRLEEKLRLALDPNSLPLARPGILGWPMQARGSQSQSYGCIETSFARRSYPDCNNGRGGFHNGLDVAAPHGTPLLAAEDGKVIAIGNAPSAYGVWLAVEHTNGLVTAYTHMSSRALDIGQQVKRGDVVGRMGSTGLSTGNHIHFMVYAPKTFTVKPSTISGTLPIGATLNPLDYL